MRITTVGVCLLTLAAACSSSHKSSSPTTTTAGGGSTSTTDPDNTPNSIPFTVGEQMGLPHGWLVTVVKVHQHYSAPGLHPAPAGRQYVAIDIRLSNQGSTAHTVDANRLFTLTDSLHKSHYVVAQPGHANGIDGAYPPGTAHSGTIVFLTPTNVQLGLVMYGPFIGTQVSYFAIVPPTVAPQN